MKNRAPRSSEASEATRKGVKEVPKSVNKEASGSGSGCDSASGFIRVKTVRRSGTVWFTLCLLITYSTYTVYNYQYDSLPPPLSAEQAGKRGFSEVEAMKHVKRLTGFGPHPIASDALDDAFQYVLEAAEKIRTTAHREVDVQVEVFQAKPGANRLVGGLFKGKTLAYSDLSHIVLRIMPKYGFDAGENAILVSSHIETVFSTGGAGDCSSCVAVMLELARSISQWAHGFKNSIIFLFNTGEEEGLNGAHSFITQHPFNATIRMAIDLEATGVGGKSSIFQTGSDPWAIETYASVAKYPSGHIIAQELFTSGVIKSATDFQVYKEVAGLSGLDFAYADNTAVYHTKNDKLKFVKPGSLQHLGENLLAFLLRAASLSSLSKGEESVKQEKSSPDPAIYFDILGQYMIVYRYSFAKMFQSSVIMQSLLIWATSLFMGGYPAAVSLALSCLSIILMWIFSITFSVFVAFILPLISSSPVPFAANPWLAFGLFASPAILGAITGQHFGCIILQKVLSTELSKRTQLSLATRRDLVKLESERWLFKGGFIQWLVLLIFGTYYEIGSSFVALVWLLPPAFAYGLLEATLTPIRLPKPLKLATLIMSLAVPILVSSGIFIRLSGLLIGMVVRFDRNPGGTPEWLGSVIVAAVIAAFVCLTLVYLLSYLHLSGAKRSIVVVLCILTAVSLALVSSGVVPAFTDDIGRAVGVVHVVDTTNKVGGQEQDNRSFVSLFSYTPGNLEREVEHIKEGFRCGRDMVVDYVLFQAKYGCVTEDEAEIGWSKEDIPTLHVEKDAEEDYGTTRVSIDTKGSIRWALAINFDEVQDFSFQAGSEELVPVDEKSSKDGWHKIQYAGGKKAPTRFTLTLSRRRRTAEQRQVPEQKPLLKLRTDFNRVTPKTERILNNLPSWCSLFGKSTSPLTLAFLADLPL